MFPFFPASIIFLSAQLLGSQYSYLPSRRLILMGSTMYVTVVSRAVEQRTTTPRMHQRSAALGAAEVVSEGRGSTRCRGNSPHRCPGTPSASLREAMGEGGDASDTDSDETIIEGSVGESDLDEEELRGKR